MAAEFRNVRIPAEAHERLQRLSALSGRSMSALIAAFSGPSSCAAGSA
jgi:predicted DNA-binding protein